jgi:hypothetical protein
MHPAVYQPSDTANRRPEAKLSASLVPSPPGLRHRGLRLTSPTPRAPGAEPQQRYASNPTALKPL